MAINLADGNYALALLANALATGCILAVLIVLLGPFSGAHFNPAVTLAVYMNQDISRLDACSYVIVQVAGGITGVLLAHVMFDLSALQLGTTQRTGHGMWISEGVATFGLVAVVLIGFRFRPKAVAALVGSYIAAAYWFAASTSFANPAVTIARSFTDTFSGIDPVHAPLFLLSQFIGAITATFGCKWLLRNVGNSAT